MLARAEQAAAGQCLYAAMLQKKDKKADLDASRLIFIKGICVVKTVSIYYKNVIYYIFYINYYIYYFYSST